MSGLGLAVVALGVAGVALGHYATTVRAVRVAKRPRGHQAAIVVAALLALVAAAEGAGLLGGTIAGAVLAVAAVFLFLTTQSALPPGRIAVVGGGPALDFTASDSDGRAFTLSSLRGQRILLKFFRGHW